MKKIFKILSLFIFFLSGSYQLISQVKFIGNTNRFQVTGKGDIRSNQSDNARIVNWIIDNATNFETTVYLETLDFGKSGIIIRDANVNNNLEGGRACYYLYLEKPSNRLKLDYRNKSNELLANLFTINNINAGLWLNLKKTGNNLLIRYSLSAKSAVNSQTWINIENRLNAFNNFTYFSRGIIVASGNNTNNISILSNWKPVINDIINTPIIASSITPLVAGNNSTLTATNCNYTIDWFKNTTFVSSGASLAVNNAILNDIYSAKCRNNTLSSNFSNQIVVNAIISNGTIGSLVDLNFPTTTKWNYFDPDLIPDFTPARSTDIKTGLNLPNRWFIWHAPYRNLFGINDSDVSRLVKMTKKGVTAWNISKLPAYNSTFENVVIPERIVSETYGLGINNGNPHPEEQSYTAFANWAKGGVMNASSFGVVPINGKYNQLFTINDYENLYTNLTTQTASNYHTVALNSMADIATNRVAFQYGLGLNTGGYYISSLYNGSNNVWSLPANNAVSSEFIGKSSASNNRIVGVNEITYAFETFLPENYQVQDQNNQNWFSIKHFGKELDNSYSGGQLDQCNAQHWATNIGVGTETAYQLHKNYANGGQDVVVQLKPVSETDNGYHYDQRYAEFRGGKYGNYVNRYGIINLVNGVEQVNPMGSEYLPNFIAEGQVMLAYFCGAKGINWWSSDFTDTAIPKDKAGNPRRGAKYNDTNYGNRDLDAYLYTLKALWRLNQKITLSNGQSYSFNEIADDNAIFLNQSTKVVYPNSSVITQLRALDWQISKKSPVRAVVNVAKNVVMVIAFQAYGVEDNQVTFKLTDYGANISEIIDIPAGKIIVKAFPLTGVVSEGGTIVTPTITSNVSNPTANQSVTLTSSGCQSGYTNKWYDSAEGNLLTTGNTYTVNAVNGNGYYAKCTNNVSSSNISNIITFSISTSTNSCQNGGNFTITSVTYNSGNNYYVDFNAANLSNARVIIKNSNNVELFNFVQPINQRPQLINFGNLANGNYSVQLVGLSCNGTSNAFNFTVNQVPITSEVTITQPNQPSLYFSGGQDKTYWSNNNNIPSIFTNTPQFSDGDVVKMKNSEIEIWIDLKAGGQICYASLGNTNKNLVYIGYDRGFQWQADYTQHLVGGMINGQTSGSPQNNSDYNNTMGGDYLNHGVLLTDYHLTQNGFYTEVRPLLYPFNSLVSEVKMQTTYTLIGNLLKVDYKYISFRTDPYIETNNPFRYKGFDLPVMFCLEEYSKYGVYNGNNAWSNEPIEEGNIPNTTANQNTALSRNSLERWGMIFNPVNDDAIGVYNSTTGGTASTLVYEQLNKYSGVPQGTNTTGARTIMKLSKSIAIPNGNSFVDESTAYITFGKRNQIRERFRVLSGH